MDKDERAWRSLIHPRAPQVAHDAGVRQRDQVLGRRLVVRPAPINDNRHKKCHKGGIVTAIREKGGTDQGNV